MPTSPVSKMLTSAHLISMTSESSFRTRGRSQSAGGGCQTRTDTPSTTARQPRPNARVDAPADDASALSSRVGA
jgi:hypothetical protein